MPQLGVSNPNPNPNPNPNSNPNPSPNPNQADDETDFSREGPGRLVSDSRAEALAHKEAVRAAAAAALGSPPVAADPAPERRPSTTKRQSAGQLNAERGISVRV